MHPVFIIVLLSIIGVAGDTLLKIAGLGKEYIDMKWFIIGLVVYASTAFGWFYVMKYIKLSLLGPIYAITTTLFLVLVGIFFFHEKLTISEVLGVTTAIISLLLLSKFS